MLCKAMTLSLFWSNIIALISRVIYVSYWEYCASNFTLSNIFPFLAISNKELRHNKAQKKKKKKNNISIHNLTNKNKFE